MKKTITIFALSITFMIIYFLHINFFNYFTIAGVKPNLFVILVLFIGLYAGKRMGTAFGIGIGLIIDSVGSSVIGGSAVALGLVGFLGGYLEKNFSKDSKITVILMCILSTASYETFIYLYNGLILVSNIEIFLFIKILFIELLYNTLLTIIIYPLMQKLVYKMEGVFKKHQILTRYF